VTRRLLSTAIQMREPIPPAAFLMSAMDPSQLLRAQTPTHAEVVDAMQKLAAELKDMVTARTAGADGWTIGDMEIIPPILQEDGSVTLRGFVIIERPDDV
jgi:hypothetical protein